MSAIKLPEGTQTTSSEGVTIQQKDHGDGLNIQGTPNDDTIIGSSQGDWIEGSTGNDLIYGAGTGSTGYSHVDQDTVRYGEDLYVFNRSTNENVKAFDITTNADGSVSIIRNDLTGTGNISTDILYNISNIIFGDGENAVQVQLEQRTQIDTWGVDGRQINIMGGIANDLIQGQDKGDRLFGGDGNDIILGDAHQVAESSITAAGGHFYDKPLPTGGSAQNNFTVDPGTISTATFVGTNSSDSNQVNHQITASLGTASTLHFKVDGADNAAVSVIQGALGNLTDLTTFASEVSQARESGFEVTLWVEHTATINGETVVGAVLLDVIDSQNYSAGDEIEGGSGNDFIDGGLSGNQTEHPWENDNHARYSGKFENYDLKQINLADSSGSEAQFNDGTTIASWWVQQPQSEGESITTFAELRTILGLDHAQVDLAPGTYTVVSDQSGNDGIDLVSNVQWLNFDGDWQRIEVEINPINWRNDSEPSGDRYQGTVFSDLITGTSSYDEIQSHQGNDLILAGGGGDHINAGAGNDFIDGGASGSAYNGDRWRDSDEVRIDGSSKRYEITQQTQADVEVYWANNFTNHGQTFNGNQTYFLIEDLSPVAGNGSVLVTNVDRINFSDKEVWLDTSIDYWDSSVGNDVAQQPTQTFNVRGTQFSDTVDISSLTNGLTTGALWRVEFTGGAGDDVFIGDAMGSSVRDGAGNDLIIGGDSPTTLSNNDRWYGKDQVEFQGAKERYEIEAYVNGDIITDSLGNVVFNLTQLANGQITTADNKDHQVGSGISQVYVVRDTLPDRFDGDGINLLVGVEEIYFDGGHVNLIKEIYENTWEDPSDPNYVRSIEVQGTQFDDIINTEATGIANETGVNNRVSGNDGNDYITTGGGSDRIEPGRGNDFIDGGAPGTIGNKWDREDVVHFNANKTSFEIKLASEEETIAFWSEHFAGHSFTYNGSQDYYLVEDTNPIEGYGTNLVTNIGRLSFDNSGDVRLNYRSELEYWSSDNLDNLWIEGSQFSDVLISSDEVPQHTFTSGASLSFGMRGDDGDDVFIGGDEDNGIQGDGGNDLLVGYTSNNTYNGDDNAQYGNKFSRYEITTVSDGHRVYQTAGDANSGLIYDLSDFSNGNIATSDGTIYSVGSHEKAYVIRDTLSTDLGGDGIDLVIGMDKLQFDGSQQRLTPEVYEDNNNSVRLGNANFTEFDDTYDLSSGILTQQGNVVNEGHVDTYVGNDMVIGFSGGTKFRGGAGDDVFIVPDNYVNDDSGWWNENEIRFSGPSNRYDIETGYVAFNIDGLPSYSNNGSIDWSDAETAGAKSAIRITDTLENELGGEGTDYAIGVDRVYFDTGDVSIRVGTTANDQVWDFWVDGDFRDQYGDIVGEKIENAMEVRKIVGSRFNDVITADDDIDTSLPTGWTSINISQNLLNSLLTDSNPVLFEVTNNGNNLLETIPLSELDQNNQPTANLWVESATDATVLSSALLANPNDLHGLDFDALSGSIQLYISSNHPENSLSSVFAHFEVNSATDVQQTVNRGMNFLNGQQGDDILIGGNGPDKFSGGTGDDIMIGGGQDARSDQVEYSGAQSQYSFAPIWVKLNNDHQIIAESQTKIDESYQSATVITDTDTSDGGSGRDILIGIERANFNGDDSRINLVEETRFELRDGYYPGANLAGDDLVGFPYIKIKTADISETLSIQDIVNAYTYTPYHSTTDFGFNLTTDSFREVEASSGNDTLFGLATNSVWSTTSKGDDVFVINGVALKDLNITQGFDTELNKAYVEVTNTLTFQGGYDIGTNRLYDFEQIQINEPGSWDAFKFPLTLNPSLESGQWLGFDYASIEDSLFDDTIDDAMVASFGAAPDRYQGIKIAIRGGNDTIDISTGSLFVGQEWVSKWDINNGNDHISTGHGLDVYYGNKELYEYEVAYFLDANSNKTRDAGEEITLEQFRTDGVTIYDGANAKGLSGNSEISFADYQTNHAGKRLFTETGDFWSRDAGWFDYNDNYYVEIQHSVPDSLNGTGTDVLHDVEIFAGNSGDKEAILDILTGAVHLQGWLYPGWDGKTYDASLVTTNDVSSDLSALRPAAIPSSALGTVNLIDDATEVVYDFDPNRSTYWNLDLRYDGDDQHHTRLIGTDGNVTLSYGDNLYEAAGIAITKANADAIADGAPIASLQTQANNYAINNNLTFYTQDNVHLGPGNDIIDLRGEAAQDVPGGGHMQDNL